MQVKAQRALQAWCADRQGSITVIAAVILPILIGIASLVGEFGHGLLTKVTNQRVADLAAYSGALAYNSSGSTTTMNAAMSNIATLNGLTGTAVTGSVASSPSGNGNQAVSASVSTTQLLFLAPVLRSGSSLSVGAAASAEMSAAAPGCIIALSSGGTGVTLSGGTSVLAPNCAVASNATVTVPCGTSITTKVVDYYSASVPSQPCSGIQPPSGTSSVKIIRVLTADPLASNAGVAAGASRMSGVAALTSPGGPTVTGTPGNIDFAYSASSTQSQATAAGCSATFAGSTWTLTCPNGGSYKFNNITLGGGITVNFNTGGTAATTYSFKGSIANTGTALNFGPGIYNIAGGLTTGGGTTTTFGAGTFTIGQSASACSGGARYSICHTGTTLTFGGPSTFILAGGVYSSGGTNLTFGSGTTNSYQIGASSAGDAIVLAGGSKTIFADATGVGGLFTLAGNLNVVSGGGSCLTLPAASQHDVNGNFATAGGTILGSGVYTINGYVGLGINGGGDVTCSGATVGLRGTNVTFFISGVTLPASGSCSGMAFCLAAGYSNVALTAPTSGTMAGLVVIGPQVSSRTGGATFAEGASNTSLSGAFYFPYGPVSLSGGASVGGNAGQCLTLVGTQITLSGGTAAATACVASSGSGAGAGVKLVN